MCETIIPYGNLDLQRADCLVKAPRYNFQGLKRDTVGYKSHNPCVKNEASAY